MCFNILVMFVFCFVFLFSILCSLCFCVILCIISLLYIRGGADKSLARPTSRCRTESIVSLERGVCSCAELQDFSCYGGWKEADQATCGISTTSRRELSKSFFSCKARRRSKFTPFWQKNYGNMHHRMPPSKTGWLSLNMVIFPSVMHLVLDDPK